MTKKIYVGNLPFSATEEGLRAHFAQHGEVTSVKIIIDGDTGRSRGFGFVEMDQDVSPLYLQQLNELYNAWIEDFTLCPILTVPADNLDFVRFSKDFTLIKEKIMEKWAGREKVYFP